jgi:hypothetical protein
MQPNTLYFCAVFALDAKAAFYFEKLPAIYFLEVKTTNA